MKKYYVRTFSFYLGTALALLIVLPILLVVTLLPKRLRYSSHVLYGSVWLIYKAMLWSGWFRIQIVGDECTIRKKPCIVVANHQSALDIALVGQFFCSQPHTWLFKHELSRVPLLGWMAQRLFVSVDRGSLRKAASSISQSLRLLSDYHLSLGIFPEGQRHIDGKVHDFLSGFAMIAKKTALPVVPVLIEGAHKVYPPGVFFIRGTTMRVHIGPYFIYEEGESEEHFKQRVHNWFMHNNSH